MGLAQVAGVATNEQLERLLELPLVDFEEGRSCHVYLVTAIGYWVKIGDHVRSNA